MNARVRSVVIIALVVLVDRATKIIIRNQPFPQMHVVIPGFFNIVHYENPGAAFGVLADSASMLRPWLLIGVSLGVMVVIAMMLFRPPRARAPENPLLQTALALVFGGALGNLWDRVFRGSVTDFLQFFFGSYEFPSFNAADSAITIGAGLLLIDLWRNRGKR